MLSSKRQGDVVFISFAGTNTLDVSNVDTFREQVASLAADARTVVIDLHELDFVDSAGLRALIWLRRELNKKGRRLILYRPQRSVKEVLEVTRLIRIFTTCADSAELRKALTQGVRKERPPERARLQTIIYPSGAVVQVEASEALDERDARAIVRQVGSVTRPGRPVILDLRAVQYVDAAALWLLTEALRRAKEARSALYALVATDTLRQIFENVPAWRGHVVHTERDLERLISKKSENKSRSKDSFVDLSLVLGETKA